MVSILTPLLNFAAIDLLINLFMAENHNSGRFLLKVDLLWRSTNLAFIFNGKILYYF